MDDWFQDPFFNTPTDLGHIEQEIKKQISEVEHHMSSMIDSMNNMFRSFGSMNTFGLDYDDKSRSPAGKHSTTAPGLTYHPTFSDSTNDFSQTTGTKTPTSRRTTSTKDPIVEYPDDNTSTSAGSRRFNNSDYTSSNYNRSRNYDRTTPTIPTSTFANRSTTSPTSTYNNPSTTSPTRSFNNPSTTSPSTRSSYNPSTSTTRETKPYIYASAMSSITGPDGIQQARQKTYDSESGKTRMAEMRRLGDQAIAMKREIDREGKITDTVDRKNLDEKDVSDFRRRWDTKANQMSLGFRTTNNFNHQNALK